MIEQSQRKPFVREIDTKRWYLERGRDRLHMAQELSSLIVGLYALLMLWGLKCLADGPQAYGAFLATLASGPSLLFHLVALLVAVFHTISWFGVTPKAMPIQRGEEFVPGSLIVAGHYGVWAAVTLFILYLGGLFHG